MDEAPVPALQPKAGAACTWGYIWQSWQEPLKNWPGWVSLCSTPILRFPNALSSVPPSPLPSPPVFSSVPLAALSPVSPAPRSMAHKELRVQKQTF